MCNDMLCLPGEVAATLPVFLQTWTNCLSCCVIAHVAAGDHSGRLLAYGGAYLHLQLPVMKLVNNPAWQEREGAEISCVNYHIRERT